MLDDIVRDQLRAEILQLEDLFVEFSELLDKSARTEPSMVERAALGSLLHSFYTGLEGIFLTVAAGKLTAARGRVESTASACCSPAFPRGTSSSTKWK